MTRLSTTVYSARSGDTLDSIAAKFDLDSGRSIAEAPANKQVAVALPLRENQLVHIPPPARSLLVERLGALQRLRPLLQRHFEHLDDHCSEGLQHLESSDNVRRDNAPEVMLSGLAESVRDAVNAAHLAARLVAQANLALALTHLHDTDELTRFVAGDPAVAGLNWVLTPERLSLWYDMWDPAFWSDRWLGKSGTEVVQSVATHLNLVRSLVMQQADGRIRGTQAMIAELPQTIG